MDKIKLDALKRAAEKCEFCQLVLSGTAHYEPARSPDGLIWIHDDGNGEQVICEAGDIWEEVSAND